MFSSSTPHQTNNQLLLTLLEMLVAQNPEAANLLRRRYIDDETGFAVANRLGISDSSFYRHRRQALDALTNVALTLEQDALQDHISRLEQRLEPSTYHKLFGLAKTQARLTQLLQKKSDIKTICLVGIGGIGKSSLADAVVRDIIAQQLFDDVAWVSARQQQWLPWGDIQENTSTVPDAEGIISALYEQLLEKPTPPLPVDGLQQTLKSHIGHRSHLIVLDNFETVAASQQLLQLVSGLSQHLWLLITSRTALHEYPGVYNLTLNELKPNDAEALIRDEAFRRGIEVLAEAPPESIAQIYAIAGGNPLALKLIVGQVQIRSLSGVLNDLSKAQGHKAEALYEYIYHQAWNLLDDNARKVLLVMPMVTAMGTTLEHLTGVTHLSESAVVESLELLTRLSLVNVGGSLDDRRYSIHKLTESFLNKQVSQWQ